VLTANGGGHPGVQVVQEVDGVPTAGPVAPMTLPGPDFVDLYITVDPAAATIDVAYRATTNGAAGPLTTLTSGQAIPRVVVHEPDLRAGGRPHLDVLGRSALPATWSMLDTTLGPPTPEERVYWSLALHRSKGGLRRPSDRLRCRSWSLALRARRAAFGVRARSTSRASASRRGRRLRCRR